MLRNMFSAGVQLQCELQIELWVARAPGKRLWNVADLLYSWGNIVNLGLNVSSHHYILYSD